MSWAMQDESVKVQMFRFIDVLPMLDRERRRHPAPARVLPRRAAAPALGRAAGPGRGPARLDRRPRTGDRRPAQCDGACPAVHRRHERDRSAGRRQARTQAQQRAFTLDVLGEAVTSEREADRYLKTYLDLIAGIAPIVNAWPEVPQIDRAGGREIAARQRLGQALGARQPVRPDRSDRHDAPRRRAPADAAACGPRAPGVRQRRHGIVHAEGPDARHLPADHAGGRVPPDERRGHRDSVLSARLAARSGGDCAIGPRSAARRSGCDW